ncbi:hypothetical protein H6G76_14740 [Nostoc sp. FACHB-152]|uniref:hypothetical protein n=1 Tax=unclassified Nostoc TaxID=2593658 RepID=UPI001686632D|nr:MULTISPECIES: hypothetical protein [unclassified Nostoc]MBD2448393.1 hypothetical protein [Nostoc sp. FACHB-152]MBD2470833.1 hypothetical protein [Nostoc sp. FACHB-145]
MPIDLKQFRQHLIYKAQAPVAKIIDDLQEIAEVDHLAELKQKEYGQQTLYYFLGIIITVVLMLVAPNAITNTGLQSVLVALFALAIIVLSIGFIYALVNRFKFGRINVVNSRYQSTQRILQMLSRDMDANADIELQLSFQPIEKDEYKTNTTPHPIKSGWKIDHYQHEWLKIQGQFLDKTRFELSATDISKKQYGWKRGSSGKSKYKSKTKSGGLDINLNITYPQRRYGAVKLLKNEATNAIKLSRLAHLRGLRITDKAMHIVVRVAPNVVGSPEEVYQTITAMFLSVYQILNLAKVLSKQNI